MPKKILCDHCGGTNLKTRSTTYPVQIGKQQLRIRRVPIRECIDCHCITPTSAGKEKIEVITTTFMSLMSGH